MILLSEFLAEVVRDTRDRLASGDVAEETVGFREWHAGHLLAAFGDRPITDFAVGETGRRLLKDYVRAQRRTVKGHTISKRLGTLKLALAEARAMGVLHTWAEFPKLDGYRARETFLLREEYDAIRLQLQLPRRAWLDLCLWTGMHSSDVEGLTWSHVRSEVQGELRVWSFLRHNTKNRASAIWCKAPRVLNSTLTELAESRAGNLEGPIVGAWDRVSRDLSAACKRAGVDKTICPLDLRRTLATWWCEAGGDRYVLKKYLGHSSRSKMIDMVYAQVTPRQIADGVDALDLHQM